MNRQYLKFYNSYQMSMKKFNVTGMSCSACVTRVENAVKKLKDVESCSVNLLTNSMIVEGNAKIEEIEKAVFDAGYKAFCNEKSESKSEELVESDLESNEKKEISLLKNRLISSILFLLILMYFSMGNQMFNFPIPSFFEKNLIGIGLLEFILASIVMIINKKFFINGFRAIIKKSPTMDSLVALGSGISWIFSLIILFEMTKNQVEKSFYFESSAMIVTLITVGKLLEAISKGKTTNALKSLMKLQPKTALILDSADSTKEKEIPIENVKIGDIFLVKPGMQIAVDGIVLEGNSSVNESALTGESLPVEKSVDSSVFSGTINTFGFLKCKATKVGSDTTLSKIIQMVSDSASTKAPIAKIADKVSGIFVPTIILIAILTVLVWLFLGTQFNEALSYGISVLVVSCPCALGLATPVAIMVGNGIGAKNGILFKNSTALEIAGKTKIVALDKTGTITKGNLTITDDCKIDNEILQMALDLEVKSEHPLAKAIVNFAKNNGIIENNIEDFEVVSGLGVKGILKNHKLFGGNFRFILENVNLTESEKIDLEKKIESIQEKGQTALIFAKTFESKIESLGIISVSDSIKEDSKDAISLFKKNGLKTVMLTGDNKKTANFIAFQIGIDEVLAEILPDEKEKAIQSLKKDGQTIMVGDGINDAVALTSADVGIAIGAGTDIARDSADIILVKNSLLDVAKAIKLSKATLKNIRQNLFWAFFYNILLIPVAMGVYSKFGIKMNPMFGAFAMSLSSFCVVTNALRLNFIKFNKIDKKHKTDKIDSNQNQIKKEQKMIFKVEGMMCPHCEAHVKEALEKIDGVTKATASHEKKQVEVEFSKDVSTIEIEKAIVNAGYKFLG